MFQLFFDVLSEGGHMREREREKERERGIKVFGRHPRLSVNKMAFHWEDLENLISLWGLRL